MPVHYWDGECELNDLALGTIERPYAGGESGLLRSPYLQ